MTIVDHLRAVLAIQNPKNFRSAEDQRVLEEAERTLATGGRCDRCEAMHPRDHGVASTVGVIDIGYRGEVGVTLINHGQQPYTVVPGERVAQLVIVTCVVPMFAEVDRLPDSERGASGFGSTGRQ